MPEREQVAKFLTQVRGRDEITDYELACADQLIAWFERDAPDVIMQEVLRKAQIDRLLETIEWLQTIQHRTQHQGMQVLGHNEATCEAKSCVHARTVLSEVREQLT